jgi:Ni/Co efflux regulator RcnB
MTTRATGSRGRGLRDAILLAIITAPMALSACMTSQEKKQREEAFARHKARWVERIEQAEKEEEEKKAARDAEFKDWVKKNEPYLRGLCTTAPGHEHLYAWDSYRVAVSTDPKHAAEAAASGRPIINCEELLQQETSALGYTWSNAPTALI